MNIYDIQVTTASSEEKSLADYRGKVLLIVNVASKCGFTPQYKGLQALYDKYKDQGLEILGFPCNQFLGQEPGTNEEIQEFCQVNFGASFPIFAKIDVNGSNAHPLYKHLTKEASGILGGAIKWNFTKFLVDRDGKVVKRYAPNTEPEKLAEKIEELLQQ
ncbi:glutathione peroxidase [Shimazuella alba]|uniref:Glutathione peroxidase n=1 Tax=Shimazuella alba TaxID=2690964 RepID=A0A6I4VXK7_9BACL|nr:glutathione peroxidase [Shimazuella alba]MXQ54695.1 redoxin domain-containing protein [Shimazuella alba]